MLKRQAGNNKITEIKREIRETYLNTENTPWIIGYSGGKDSTTVLQLVIEVLLDLQADNLAKKTVYVISSDTLVENPLVIAKTNRSMKNINDFAAESNIPLVAEMVYPDFSDTFFVNMIGRGYPSPLQSFRWCTDRIKIKPANEYIYKKISDNGEVILLLGTREEESASRKRSMEKHNIDGSVLSLHGSISSAWTYAPIAKMTVNEIWDYLLRNNSPWGDSNDELYKMYSDSSLDGECPLVIDEETKKSQTCGNSRFGCWTCTVVVQDKSLTGFIESGEEWLKPFLDYRNYLIEIRDNTKKRNLFDRNGNLKKVKVIPKNGQIIIPEKLTRKAEIIDLDDAITEEIAFEKIRSGELDPRETTTIIYEMGEYYRIGVSGFTYETRMEMLRKLLEVEKAIRITLTDYEILRFDEILAIDKAWKNYGYLEVSAIQIYNEYHETKIIENRSRTNIDVDLLSDLADEYEFNKNTLMAIVNEVNQTKTLKNRSKTINYIESKLKEHKLILEEKNENK